MPDLDVDHLVGRRNDIGSETVAVSVLTTEENSPKTTTLKLKLILARKESRVVADHKFFHEGGGLGRSEISNVGARRESTKDFGKGRLRGQRPFYPRVFGTQTTKLSGSLVGQYVLRFPSTHYERWLIVDICGR